MNSPRKAILLAAGFGKRLRPLTHQCPKPLVPLWGVPTIEHLLRLLVDWEVQEVFINTHYSPRRLGDFTAALELPLDIRLAHEPEILGTGGVLHAAADFLDGQPFWMVNGDIAADLPREPLVQSFERSRPLASVWLHPSAGPRTVELKRGVVTSFRSGKPGGPGTYTFCGIHLISPRVMDFLPPPGFSSVIEAYEQAMRAGETIRGVTIDDACWADLGTPESYRQAHRDVWNRHRAGRWGKRLLPEEMLEHGRRLEAQGVRIQGFAAVQRDAIVKPGARLHDSVVWTRCEVGPRAELHRSILGRGVSVNEKVESAIVCPVRSVRESALKRAVRMLRWKSDATHVITLPARGSARTYYRLVSGPRRAVVVSYSLERPENGLFVRHARFLNRLGIRVPQVLHHSTRHRVAVLEDLGSRSLLDAVVACGSPNARLALYTGALQPVVQLHRHGKAAADKLGLPLNEPFNRKLYAWEHDLFEQRCLLDWFGVRPRQATRYRRAIEDLTAPLEHLPQVLLHRDLQSTNILLWESQAALIDFQGMRYGPAVYDLASLLCDPYVQLTEAEQIALVRIYAEEMGTDPVSLDRLFWLGAVQRLVQALGAFCRLAAQPQTARFADHIVPGFAMLERALCHLGKTQEIWHSLCYLGKSRERSCNVTGK